MTCLRAASSFSEEEFQILTYFHWQAHASNQLKRINIWNAATQSIDMATVERNLSEHEKRREYEDELRTASVAIDFGKRYEEKGDEELKLANKKGLFGGAPKDKQDHEIGARAGFTLAESSYARAGKSLNNAYLIKPSEQLQESINQAKSYERRVADKLEKLSGIASVREKLGIREE